MGAGKNRSNCSESCRYLRNKGYPYVGRVVLGDGIISEVIKWHKENVTVVSRAHARSRIAALAVVVTVDRKLL